MEEGKTPRGREREDPVPQATWPCCKRLTTGAGVTGCLLRGALSKDRWWVEMTLWPPRYQKSQTKGLGLKEGTTVGVNCGPMSLKVREAQVCFDLSWGGI